MATQDERNAAGLPAFDRRLIVTSASIVGCYALGLVGLAFLPILLRDTPHLLILLNPTTTVMLLVSDRVSAASFFGLAAARRVALHVLCFLLGAWYGPAAVRWAEERAGGATAWVRFVERAFARVRWAVIFLAPGPLPSVLAGAGRMWFASFLAIDLAGTIAALLLIRFAADVASDPLALVIRLIEQHAVPFTALCAAGTTLWLLVRWWRGRADVEGEE